MATTNKYNLKLNSTEKIEQLLQETYDLATKQYTEIQNEMNKLINTTDLSEATIDERAKYSKAIHDFIGDKKQTLAMKLDIARFMGEVSKWGGNIKKAANTDAQFSALNLESIRKTINSVSNSDDTQVYKM